MNFTPNSANALQTGRIEQQAPESSSIINVPQKSGIIPNSTFSNIQQPVSMSQIVNSDNKHDVPPLLIQHQIQQISQNDNSLGQESVSQNLVSTYNNINRSSSIMHQPTFQQQPQPIITSQKINMFQQLHSVYKQQMVAMGGLSVPQNIPPPTQHSTAPGQQDVLQKLQQAIPQAIQQTKLLPNQQQVKLTLNEPSVQISQQSMHYSPSKSVHPQMKTTAKLALPGSQLQSLHKPSTAPNLLHSTSHQNKTVPLITPLASLSLSQSTASSSLFTSKQTNVGESAQMIELPSKLATAPIAMPVTSNLYLPSSTISKISPETVLKQTKAENQLTEVLIPSIQNKAGKPSKEITKNEEFQSLSNDFSTVDMKPAKTVPPTATGSTIASIPLTSVQIPAVVAKVTKSTSSSSKGTMRLATVTPTRQKKPVPTNNKKLQVAPSVLNTKKILGAPKPVSKPCQKAATKDVVKPGKANVSNTSPEVVQNISRHLKTSSAITGSVTASPTAKTKRSRVKVQPYQIPTPEIAFVTKLSAQTAKTENDDKLIIFYK